MFQKLDEVEKRYEFLTQQISDPEVIARQSEWKGLMKNDFEKSVFAKYPAVREIKDKLYDMGAIYASMSGSGSAFFGIFNSECNIEMLKAEYPNMFCQQWKL